MIDRSASLEFPPILQNVWALFLFYFVTNYISGFCSGDFEQTYFHVGREFHRFCATKRHVYRFGILNLIIFALRRNAPSAHAVYF